MLYRDTLEFTIYKEEQGFGNNVFTITLDPLNEINEIDKANNTAELNLFIPLNAARNLSPQGFSIVHHRRRHRAQEGNKGVDKTGIPGGQGH